MNPGWLLALVFAFASFCASTSGDDTATGAASSALSAQESKAERALFAGGRQVSAAFRSLDDSFHLTVVVGGQTRRLSNGEWYGWGEFEPAVAGHHLLLVDGSQLVASVVALTEKKVIAESRTWGTVSVPRSEVIAIVFTPPQPWRERDRLWDRLRFDDADAAVEPARRDWILLTDGDEATGRIVLAQDAPARLPFFLPPVALRLDPLGDIVRFPAKRIRAIRFAGRRLRSSESSGAVGLRDGSRLLVRRASISKEGADLELSSGFRLARSGSAVWRQVCYVRSPPEVWHPLDQQSAFDSLQVPMWTHRVPFQQRRSAARSRLRINGAEYEHGIGMFGRGRVVYDVPANAKRLVARVGIDQQAGRGGSVVFRVYTLDEQGAPTLAAASPRMTGGVPPHLMAVSVAGASRIVLVTDPVDHGEVLDYADWLDLRWVDR